MLFYALFHIAHQSVNAVNQRSGLPEIHQGQGNVRVIERSLFGFIIISVRVDDRFADVRSLAFFIQDIKKAVAPAVTRLSLLRGDQVVGIFAPDDRIFCSRHKAGVKAYPVKVSAAIFSERRRCQHCIHFR